MGGWERRRLRRCRAVRQREGRHGEFVALEIIEKNRRNRSGLAQISRGSKAPLGVITANINFSDIGPQQPKRRTAIDRHEDIESQHGIAGIAVAYSSIEIQGVVGSVIGHAVAVKGDDFL